MDKAALGELSGEDLAEVIGQVHALEAATRATMLQLVAAFDRSEAWRADGPPRRRPGWPTAWGWRTAPRRSGCAWRTL